MDEKKSKFDKDENFINRELSWIEFDHRVLREAKDSTLPLFERLKFTSIVSSNLDEFFMVRVASLKDMVHAGYEKKDIAGLSPKQQLEQIAVKTHELVRMQYENYNRSIIPELKKNGLRVIESHEKLTKAEAEFVDRYFMDYVYPVITPMAVDSSRPFPLIKNKSLNIAALLKRKKDTKPLAIDSKNKKSKSKEAELDFALVQVPSVIPRVIEIPKKYLEENKQKTIIFLEEIVERNMTELFLNYDIVAAAPFRIMRNAEFELDEEDAADLLEEIEKQLKKRQWGEAIRLEAHSSMNKKLLKRICKELDIDKADIFEIDGPIDLTVLMKVYDIEGFDKLKAEKHIPSPVPELMNNDDIFTNIRKQDILLSHPYESFDPVVEFIKQSAVDPKVLAIKQTLYRVSGNSPIIAALAKAAGNGKQVTVLVELKARFDEEHNIIWAKTLEKAGCHVIYGLVGLKTHSKITLVVRDEEDGIRRYVHVATGNYNDSTAKLYTDMGLFTCSREFGEDATAVFNMLSGYSEPPRWNKLVVAPLWMKEKFLHLIRKTKRAAEQGKKASIKAKVNSLSDKDIIVGLYEAAAAGVEIDLIVRGICCLKTGLDGISGRIRVRSIVGDFLEHARIFYFDIDGDERYFMGSADWMPRNLEKRVEIVFPIDDDAIKRKLDHYLDTQLADNVKASIMQPDGTYIKPSTRGKKKICSQNQFVIEAEEAASKVEKSRKQAVKDRTFTPMK